MCPNVFGDKNVYHGRGADRLLKETPDSLHEDCGCYVTLIFPGGQKDGRGVPVCLCVCVLGVCTSDRLGKYTVSPSHDRQWPEAAPSLSLSPPPLLRPTTSPFRLFSFRLSSVPPPRLSSGLNMKNTSKNK